MSGSASVPFAIAAVFAEQTYQKALLAAASITCFVLATYRIWAAERSARNSAEDRVEALESEYPHSLRLDAIDCAAQDVTNGSGLVIGRTFEFQPVIQNTVGRPVEYQFVSTLIDGLAGGTAATEVIGGHARTKFYCRHVPAPFPPTNGATNHSLQFEYTYGEPGQHSRRARKTISLVRQANGDIGWVYHNNQDTSI